MQENSNTACRGYSFRMENQKKFIKVEYEQANLSPQEIDTRIFNALNMLINLNDIQNNEEEDLQFPIQD